ncbi:MAG TPA: class I SAM-dependent methyltransferase [Rhizomicrobium sp.]|jgi:ubiquinone/menaquinone biosynthesis C-methylase UbiE
MAATQTQRLAYTAAQTARVAFYGAHYLAARMLARDNFTRIARPEHPLPSGAAMLRAIGALFARDWKNVEGGLYDLPLDLGDEIRHARKSLNYLSDIPRVVKRQRRHGHDEAKAKDAKNSKLPRYYRQNFHYQTDGYLSDRSARLYEFQVEALFAGTADAMRRQAFVPLAREFAKDAANAPTVLDIGAGTGRFLSFVKSARPDWKAVALDLSAPYLARAKKALPADVQLIEAAAEKMPLQDASVDAAVSIYLFHELPPKVRAAAAKEIARVLKPGGLFVLADTIQYGDAPEFEGLIDVFPELMHEPYYGSYVKTDLSKLFGAAGLKHEGDEVAYLTKVTTFRK